MILIVISVFVVLLALYVIMLRIKVNELIDEVYNLKCYLDAIDEDVRTLFEENRYETAFRMEE